MKDARKQLTLLLEQGEQFTYENFSAKSPQGYPYQLSPEWLSWTTRCKFLIQRLFGHESAPLATLNAGLKVVVIGNGPNKFNDAKSLTLAALDSALRALDDDVFHELADSPATAPEKFSNKVFVVHGHDTAAKAELEVFLSEIGLQPVVLHRQPDQGQTLIEKFEKHSDVGYAFILLTPDEVAYLAKGVGLPDGKRGEEQRARPNVIFEFGYFVGKLGRSRVCALHTGDVTLPSDLNGLLYKKFDKGIGEVAYEIIKELKALGYRLK
jgi:predicted nucleotide-binding protein